MEKDFVRRGEPIGLVEFKQQWESLGEGAEVMKKYSLGLESLQGLINGIPFETFSCDLIADCVPSLR